MWSIAGRTSPSIIRAAPARNGCVTATVEAPPYVEGARMETLSGKLRILVIVLGLASAGALGSAASASAQLPEFNLLGVDGSLSGNYTQITSMDMTTGALSGTASVGGEDFTVAGSESGNYDRYVYTLVPQSDPPYTSTDYTTWGILPDGNIGGPGGFDDSNGTSVTYTTELNDPEATEDSDTAVGCAAVPASTVGGATTYTCTATVTAEGGTPTGNITWDDGSAGGTFSAPACQLASGSCSVTYTPPAAGAAFSINATYSADATFKVSQGSGREVSGTVYGQSCSATTCSQAVLPGVTIVVTGKTDAGATVTESAVTAANGTWTVIVPPGIYKAGPSQDGSTIDGDGFDPEPQDETVTTTPVSDVDFAACVVGDPTDDESSAERMSALEEDYTSRQLSVDASWGAAAARPRITALIASSCKSIYTIKLSAELPSGRIVDPAKSAHYQLDATAGNPDGYNTRPAGGFGIQHNPTARLAVSSVFSQEYPACFSNTAVERDDKAGATAVWYSFLTGGPIGNVTASFIWNRSTQEAHLLSAPTVVTGRVTRTFVWKLRIHGKNQYGRCTQVSRVPMLVMGAGGADLPSPSTVLPNTQFALVVAWPVPFMPQGVSLDDDRVGERVVETIEHFDSAIDSVFTALGESYDALPENTKFAIQLAVLVFAEHNLVGALASGATKIEKAFSTYKWLGGFGKAVGEGAEAIHYTKLAQELLGFFGAASGEYPVMSAVIRGRFSTVYAKKDGAYVLYNNGKDKLPIKSFFALSASATEFPSISLQVQRTALDSTDTSATTILPWESDPFATPVATDNPYFGEKASGVLTEPEGDYSRGPTAVENILEETEGVNKDVAKAVERKGDVAQDFLSEVADAEAPHCDSTTQDPVSSNTICWVFTGTPPSP
jgi:hypothetical protein